MAEPAIAPETAGYIRGYLAELGVPNLGVLPDNALVLAAGNAMLQDDMYVGPVVTTRAQLSQMRRDRINEGGGNDMSRGERNSRMIYNGSVRALIGTGIQDFRESHLATVVRDRHAGVDETARSTFEQTLGRAFIDALRDAYPDLLPEPVPEDVLPRHQAPRSFHAGPSADIFVPLSEEPGPLAEISPTFGRIVNAIGATTKGIWERLVIATGSEFSAAAAQALAERVGLAGRVAVRLGNTVEIAEELAGQQTGQFQVVNANVTGLSDEAGSRLVRAASDMLGPDGTMVAGGATADAEEFAGMGRVIDAASEVFPRQMARRTAKVDGHRKDEPLQFYQGEDTGVFLKQY